MKKTTKNTAYDMGIVPVPFWTAIRLILKGHKLGICFGYGDKKRIRAWRTK